MGSTVLWFNSGHCLPGDGVRAHRAGLSPTRLPPHSQLQVPVTSPVNCFLPTGYKLEVPTALSLGSINLRMGLAKFRETVHLLDYQFT